MHSAASAYQGNRRCRTIRRHLVILLLVTAAGCQSWQKHHLAAVRQFSSGDLEQSRESLQKSLQSRRAEQNVLKLENAMLELASGNPGEAESELRHVRRELEYLATSDVTEKTAAVLTDDRAVAYSGRDYEQQMALNMLLIASLMNDGQDAFAYAQQAAAVRHEKHQLLAKASAGEKPPAATGAVVPVGFTGSADQSKAVASNPLIADLSDQPLALSAWLSAAVQSESTLRYQETQAAMNDIEFWNPKFRSSDSDTDAEPVFGTNCRPGHGALHVIALVGRAPEWVAETAAPTSASLLIADRILTATGKHSLPPTIAPVRIARPQAVAGCPPAGFLNCRISAPEGLNGSGDLRHARLLPLVDLNSVAATEYQANRDQELARAITRRVIKKGAVYVLKETQKIHRNTAVDLLTNVAGVAWEAMEKPDTRSWQMLPARIDVASIELPEGKWHANIVPGNLSATGVPVHIENGRNTYVVCFAPNYSLTGHVLVGGADKGAFPAGR